MKIVISSNTSWNLTNFRIKLIEALIIEGHEVIAVAQTDSYSYKLTSIGCKFVPIRINSKSLNIFNDLFVFVYYCFIFIKFRPNIYLSFTIKPTIYGSIAAMLFNIKTINNISGLGTVFIKNSWITKLVALLYKISLNRSHIVFFQNNDDRKLFIDLNILKEIKTDILPGSGIDLNYFSINTNNLGCKNGANFLYIGRVLLDKGINEFIEAARIIRINRNYVRFSILGFLDSNNITAVTKEQMNKWVEEGIIEYLGETSDVRPYIYAHECIVLPSYREGVPRSLLESAAMSKPIITTDVPGCRDVVDDGINGYLCMPYNSVDLAIKMDMILNLTKNELINMGKQGRKKMELQFDVSIVINKYLDIISSSY